MLMKIKENAANYRDKMGRKMRERCSRFSSGGVASFPREIAEKDPDLYARWESLTVAYLKENTEIISGRSSCTTTKNSRIFIFMYIQIPKLMPRHYITDTRQKKNFIAASKAFQDDYHAQVAIHCGMARLGPKKQRLTRAEWKAQKKHAMKVAAAEGALLDAAAQREGERSEARESER